VARHLATVVVAVLPLAVAVQADAGSGVSSDDVAAEIVRLEGRADDTAQQWTEASQRAEDLGFEIAEAEAAVAASAAQFDSMESQMEKVAINRFVGAGSETQLFFVDDPTVRLQEGVLRNVALNVGATDLDAVDAARTDLQADRDRLAALQAENEQVLAFLETTQSQLDQQMADLEVLYEQLKDDEIRRAYEAQVAAQKAAREQAERDAAAAVAAQAAAAQAA
jgi:peptidoglycan hydrolase CwlO-like protein